MSVTVSTDLLLRVAQATPEQQAAIERILRDAAGELGEPGQGTRSGSGNQVKLALGRIERKVDGLVTIAHLPVKEPPPRETECLRVFRLFGELLAMGTTGKAPPARVFHLMIFDKRTKAETARDCKCAKSLITNRVKVIECHFKMPMERLAAFASDLKERERTVRKDRYAKKKHGSATEEPEQYSEEGSGAGAEDEHGYLPEER